eukprot:scaffold4910_cov169-Amphora_coffeaeformis.AAC.10
MSGIEESSSSSCSSSLNAFWQKASQVVQTGDFDTYASMYHPDAVLVCTSRQEEDAATTTSTSSQDGKTKPISRALSGWKAGFDATAAGRQRVTLSFRFSQRLHGPTTAHETGIFCYTSSKTTATPPQEPTVVYLHFESLLVKKMTTGWLWMMEFQKQEATEEEWNALEDPFSSLPDKAAAE